MLIHTSNNNAHTEHNTKPQKSREKNLGKTDKHVCIIMLNSILLNTDPEKPRVFPNYKKQPFTFRTGSKIKVSNNGRL